MHKAWLNELSMSVRWSGRGSPELGLRIALTNGAPGPWPFTCTECSQKPVRDFLVGFERKQITPFENLFTMDDSSFFLNKIKNQTSRFDGFIFYLS
jgi:hypothetical protein